MQWQIDKFSHEKYPQKKINFQTNKTLTCIPNKVSNRYENQQANHNAVSRIYC